LPDGLLDQRGAVGQGTRGHLDELEPKDTVGLFVELLEDERFLDQA
jgi:hypothetical protein